MPFESTVVRAARFLGLAEDETPAEVCAALRTFIADCESTIRNENGKANRVRINGAHAGLAECRPWVDLVELTADLAEHRGRSRATDADEVRLKFERRKLEERVRALPAGDEREFLQLQLEELAAPAAKPPPSAPPPVPGPPPRPPSQVAPATASAAAPVDRAEQALEIRLTELRTRLANGETSRTRLVGLLGAARAFASMLQDPAERGRREAEIEQLAQRMPVDTLPPVRLEKLLNSIRDALRQRNLSQAPFLLEAARQLAAQLSNPEERARVDREMADFSRQFVELVPPPVPLADESETEFAALRKEWSAALGRGDLAVAAGRIAAARETVRRIRDAAARSGAERALGQAADELRRCETDVAEAARVASAEQKLAELRAAAGRAHEGRAAGLLAGARSAIESLAHGAVRQQFEQELATWAERIAAAAPMESRGGTNRDLVERSGRPAAMIDTGRRLAPGGAGVDASKVAESIDGETAARDQPRAAAGLRVPQPGAVLKLVPRMAECVTGIVPIAVHFVARSRFVLGRFSTTSRSLADYSCPLPEPGRDSPVSRVHVTLTRRGEEIMVCDGDGARVSQNGSRLDDVVLTQSPVAANFTKERTIALGGVFSVAVQHLPGAGPGGPAGGDAGAFAAAGRTMVVCPIPGCLRFLARGDVPVPAHAVWVFTDASIGAASGNAVVIPGSGLGDVQCRVHFLQEAYWLENLRSGSAIRLGDRILAKGEALPLNRDDVLQLGQNSYSVVIEN